MRFGIFYEHQLPRPWTEGMEFKLFQEALDQVELADRLGIDYAWKSSITFSKNIHILQHPKCSSRRVRSAPNRSASVTVSC